jgi:hypothetical protein
LTKFRTQVRKFDLLMLKIIRSPLFRSKSSYSLSKSAASFKFWSSDFGL